MYVCVTLCTYGLFDIYSKVYMYIKCMSVGIVCKCTGMYIHTYGCSFCDQKLIQFFMIQ